MEFSLTENVYIIDNIAYYSVNYIREMSIIGQLCYRGVLQLESFKGEKAREGWEINRINVNVDVTSIHFADFIHLIDKL